MKPVKGLFTDVQPNLQPEGTYRDALNVLLTESYGVVKNDRAIAQTTVYGGIVLFSLNYKNRTVIFGKKTDVSEIGVLIDDNYTTVISEQDFDFGNNLQAVSKINDKGELLVYWVDEKNPCRFINIDNPETDINKTLLFPTIETPPIVNTTVINGGGVKTGSHTFFIRYIDNDFTPTNYVGNSLPVYVSAFDFGGKEETNSGKSVQINLTNLDTNYRFLEVAVVSQFDGVITETNLLPRQGFSSNELTVIFTGNESFRIETLENIQIDNAYYDNAKAIITQDDTLYLGNLTKEEEFNYQPWANMIEVELEKKVLENAATFESITQDNTWDLIKDNNNSFLNLNNRKFSGYKSGEVYALYIAWVLKNGQETKAFHIPGRKALQIPSQKGKWLFVIDSSQNQNNKPDQVLEQPSLYKFKFEFDATGNTPIDGSITVSIQGNSHTFTINNGPVDFTTFINQFSTFLNAIPNIDVSESFFGEGPGVITEFIFSISPNPNNESLSVDSFNLANNVTASGLGEVLFIGTPSGPFEREYGTLRAFNDNVLIDSNFLTINESSVGSSNQGTTAQQIAEFVRDRFNNVNGLNATLLPVAIEPFLNTYTVAVETDNAVSTFNNKLRVDFQSVAFRNNQLSYSFVQTQQGTSSSIDEITTNFREHTNYLENGFGYWQNENEVYPNTESFDGTIHGDNLVGQKVRHHHFSENYLEPYYEIKQNSIDYISKGFKLKNVQLPSALADKVIGYKVYYAKRTPENKRIFDQTIYAYNERRNNQYVGSRFFGITENGIDQKIIYTYPFGALNNDYSLDQITHLKSAQKFNFETLLTGNRGGTRIKTNITEAPKLYNIEGKAKVLSADGPSTVSLNSFGIEGVFNNDTSPTTCVFKLSDEIDVNLNINLNLITLSTTENVVLELVEQKNNIYNSFDNQILVDTGYVHTDLNNLDSDPIFGGDTFINAYTFKINRRTGGGNNNNKLYSVIFETSYNLSKRKLGSNLTEVFYPGVQPSIAAAMYFRDDGRPETGNSSRDTKAFDNYVAYAQDASQVNNLRGVFPKSKFEQEATKFPTRVIRSSTFENTLENSYRFFKQDDFLDLPKTRGDLVKLVVLNNNLMPHCERGIWITKGREELEIGDIRAFVGAGNIFAAKPNEISSTPDGMLGINKPQHSLLTPFGYYVVDQFTKKVFLLNGEGLSECSANGMYNFFQNFNYDNIVLGYDPRYKRIFTKIIYVINSVKYDIILSYSPELQTFISRHGLSPNPLNFITTENRIIFVNNHLHSYSTNRLPFEITAIDNEAPDINKIVQSLSFHTEVYNNNTQIKETFDSFKLSNSYQETNEEPIVISPDYSYINDNARRIGNVWNINKFRTTDSVGRQRLKDKYTVVKLVYTGLNEFYLYFIKVNYKMQER